MTRTKMSYTFWYLQVVPLYLAGCKQAWPTRHLRAGSQVFNSHTHTHRDSHTHCHALHLDPCYPGIEINRTLQILQWTKPPIGEPSTNFKPSISKSNFDIGNFDIKYTFDIGGLYFDIEGKNELRYRSFLISKWSLHALISRFNIRGHWYRSL